MEYRVVYSKRKTIAISVSNGEVVVRSPHGVGKVRIASIVQKHEKWIKEKLARQASVKRIEDELTSADIKRLKAEAWIYFTEKVGHYSKIMGLKCSRMKITSAKKRFGSCSSEGVICFSYRLMLYPEAAREYVVVHELAHLKHLNHSKDFYTLVERYMGDYKERKRLLK